MLKVDNISCVRVRLLSSFKVLSEIHFHILVKNVSFLFFPTDVRTYRDCDVPHGLGRRTNHHL